MNQVKNTNKSDKILVNAPVGNAISLLGGAHGWNFVKKGVAAIEGVMGKRKFLILQPKSLFTWTLKCPKMYEALGVPPICVHHVLQCISSFPMRGNLGKFKGDPFSQFSLLSNTTPKFTTFHHNKWCIYHHFILLHTNFAKFPLWCTLICILVKFPGGFWWKLCDFWGKYPQNELKKGYV